MPVDLNLFFSASQYHCVEQCDRLSVVVSGRSRRVGVVVAPPEEEGEATRKKKVSFADDKGLDLVKVREISECSENLYAVLIDNQKPTNQDKAWRTSFDQPPWNDDKLIDLLSQQKVVLKSARVHRGPTDLLVGTVQVLNIAYQKNVFVRMTFDRWMSFVDFKAEYIEQNSETKCPEYDLFSFSAEISRSALRYGVVEFCVCFKSNGSVFWDNNGGVNYRLVADALHPPDVSTGSFSSENITLSLTQNIQNYSELNAWSNFFCSQPYW